MAVSITASSARLALEVGLAGRLGSELAVCVLANAQRTVVDIVGVLVIAISSSQVVDLDSSVFVTADLIDLGVKILNAFELIPDDGEVLLGDLEAALVGSVELDTQDAVLVEIQRQVKLLGHVAAVVPAALVQVDFCCNLARLGVNLNRVLKD